jgi:hypothetical protein
MVNDKFKAPPRYGFESMDVPTISPVAHAAHQWKIYAESNDAHFPRIFGDLTASQILAVYRPLLTSIQIATNRNKR